MEITNKFNLPAPIFNVLSSSKPPVMGRYSVTDLINAPLQRILKMKHWEEIEQDVSDMLWMLMGKAVHYILEGGAPKEALAEEKLTVNVGDVNIVGVADLYHEGRIEDWKITSVYSFLLGDKPEWENQLNVYAWMYRQMGFEMSELRVNAILRDWMKSKTLHDPEYPAIPFQTMPVSIWSSTVVGSYIADRIDAHLGAEVLDLTAPCCTDEERWMKPTTYAVMKKGNKRAARVLGSMIAAEDWAALNFDEGKYEIVTRPGEYTKCRSYCMVSKFCEHNPYKDEEAL